MRAELPQGIEKEIRVIDDGSVDDTGVEVDKMKELHPEVFIEYVRLERNRGKGYAGRLCEFAGTHLVGGI